MHGLRADRDHLPASILFIVGENADTRDYSDEAYERAAEPKEFLVLPGGSHLDPYDRPEYVDPAVERLVTF